MGRTVVDAVNDADDLLLGAVVDPRVDDVAGSEDLVRSQTVSELPDGVVDVLVDFTAPGVANEQLVPALERGFHLVVGTTGLSDEVLSKLARQSGRGANVLVAPNFALGAVLLMQFAAQAARYFPAVEIIELHHDKKVDAPSGTAMATARHIAQARDDAGLAVPHDPTTSRILDGARGGKGDEAVPIHSIRLPGLVAHEEVLFGGPGETLTIRHDSIDRVSFMGGVLLAIREIANHPGLTIGLDGLIQR